ncbi:hypothetical protein G6F16_013080 [Rhizopus arrhizus]|nr:hypothetical protein G6F16_013080 [Rhizopus arrhizus]
MTVKHGGGNIMLWSAITYAGVGWMCKINGNMDKTLYKEILEDELERTIEYGTNKLGLERHQVIFQHDNDPKHTSKLVKEYLEQQSYNILEWPAQSPDLNPIENMWSLLKRRLNDYETAPKGMNKLYERVTKVWESITNVRKKVGMLGLENWRILDVYHPTTRVVALLVHNEYASTATNKLDTAGIKLINDFDPRDPINLRDIKYQDLSECEKQQKMVQIHTSHLLTAMDRMRPTVRSAVARDFIAKQWITTQAFADHIKATTSTPSQATPVDTDMDEAPQPVPAGNGEPDIEQL